MLRVADCFSGVGFWIMGLNQLGIEYEHQFCVEHDKYPYTSYKAIHGDVKNYGDVTKIQGHEVEDIDLFFYSPPCQAFSVAGKGLGVEEHRGVLFFDSLRIIQHKQPRVAIMENVKGLTNKPHAETLRSMLACLTMVGYTNYLKVLNTKDYGIPQNRERVFIVSVRNDINQGFEFPETFDNGIRLKHLLESEVDEKYYFSEATELSMQKIIMRSEAKGLGFRTGIITDFENDVFKGLDANYNKGCDGKRSMFEIDGRRRMATCKEAWRLQGATDEDFEKAASVNSNSQLYKQAGNGLSVNVVVELLKQLQAKNYI